MELQPEQYMSKAIKIESKLLNTKVNKYILRTPTNHIKRKEEKNIKINPFPIFQFEKYNKCQGQGQLWVIMVHFVSSEKKTVTFFQIFTVFSVHMNFTNQEDCTPKETSYEF